MTGATSACSTAGILLHSEQSDIFELRGGTTKSSMGVKQIAAGSQTNHAFVPVIAFRGLLWALTITLFVTSQPPPQSLDPSLVLILSAGTAVYTILWSLRLPQIARRMARRPILLLADILLSMLPAWVSGGWLSPFLPFAFGALVLPGALFHWRGAAAAVGAYLLVDQLAGWTTWPAGTPPPFVSGMFLLGYARPVIAASIWPLSVTLWRWRTRRETRHTQPARVPRANVIPAARVEELSRAVIRTPDQAAGLSAPATRTLAWPRSQTLERPPILELHAAIRQVVADAEDRGLTVQLVMDGNDIPVPPGHLHLLTKAVDVGLDNILSHAHTREAEVTVAGYPGHNRAGVLITIRDHGTGLYDGTAEPPGFHQIKRLRYRLQEVEGSLEVREHDAGGVVFTVWLPC